MHFPEFFLDGLRHMHEDDRRESFLRATWERREELFAWVASDAYLAAHFHARSLPSFLHGGSSSGRMVVMGINPGWSEQENAVSEDPYKLSSPDAYVAFHHEFFDVFPNVIRRGRRPSPWFTKLGRVLSGLLGETAPPAVQRWDFLAARATIQDVIPFNSARDLTRVSDIRSNATLSAICAATLDGLMESQVRCVLAFSKQGYALLRPHLSDREDVVLTDDRGRRVAVSTGRLGSTPCILVDNQVLVQPVIPYADLIPQLRAASARFRGALLG